MKEYSELDDKQKDVMIRKIEKQQRDHCHEHWKTIIKNKLRYTDMQYVPESTIWQIQPWENFYFFADIVKPSMQLESCVS